MKHIKLYEAWSSRFNRTLQGASAIATSTNKGFGKVAKSVRDYAEKQISEEEFTLELEDGRYVIITHDPDFLLKPIVEFNKINFGFDTHPSIPMKIPVKIKEASPGFIDLFSLQKTEGLILSFKTPAATYTKASIILGPIASRGFDNAVRFSDRSGLENFLAMAMQAIITSPERGSSLESPFRTLEPSQIGMESFPEGMTAEKFNILKIFQDVILKKDIREFLM